MWVGNLAFWMHVAARAGVLLAVLLAVLGATAGLIVFANRGKGYDR